MDILKFRHDPEISGRGPTLHAKRPHVKAIYFQKLSFEYVNDIRMFQLPLKVHCRRVSVCIIIGLCFYKRL